MVSSLHLPSRCPCGTGDAYAEHCGALHRGRTTGTPVAPTAERLMRSRFSAFAVGDVPYLLATWHPATRPATLELEPGLTWRRLEILGTTAGGSADDRGTVEFVAHFRDRSGTEGSQREHSAFVRVDGRWHYVAAVG
ncbi:YchJ family protein [Patulibacter minatonensis]|uniref:YchJ family protein n=1 Tax=Patulibacter minatonensis TaxID=298163 RepID=UPI00047B2C1E|nr:YchJ family metal-binding protein [Patulibacter minatonensis]